MRLSLLPTRRQRAVYGLYGLSVTLLVGSVTLALVAPTASALVPGSDWGPTGVMASTDSAVTVRWDNSGNAASDVVARDAGQTLPHTGGKSYADVDPDVNSIVQSDFGDLSLTVSQTAGLQHQAVNVSITGGKAGSLAGSGQYNGLVLMQCWGQKDEAAPDPEHCQDGAGMVDTKDYKPRPIQQGDAALIAGGDLRAGTSVRLYRSVSGTQATLTAAVYADVLGSSSAVAATGAAGTVQFFDQDGNAAGVPLPLTDSQAVLTVDGDGSGYTATYRAAAGESYLNSQPSDAALLLPAPAAPSSGSGTNAAPDNRTGSMPFQAVDGTLVAASQLNQYVTQTTTNEVGAFFVGKDPADVVSRSFELQTGAEAPGLGCGYRSDQASTSVCWLVAVPIDTALTAHNLLIPNASPLTPSLWAQRMQVQLQFADVSQSCGAGARVISLGSESLVDAMNSWIPALCNQAGVNLGFVQTADDQARDQLANGVAPLIFTSQPVDDTGGTSSTLYAPVGLTAVTIGVLAVDSNTGKAISGIKLNARLVAKLLTESYQNAIDPSSQGTTAASDVPWQRFLPTALYSDPEFRAINPDLPPSAVISGNDLIVTVSATDATTAVWDWLLSDPDAKAFLDGCPDPMSDDTVINPFYSTRSYAECPDKAASLEATAAAWRAPQSSSNPDGTRFPDDGSYVDSAMSYPPTGAAFPQPGYYQHAAERDGSGTVTQLPLTLADLHPRESSLAAVASDVFRGQEKTLAGWCISSVACPGVTISPPGVWYNTNLPSYGTGVLGVTDGTAAAKNLLPTALLCNTDGSQCVGADNDALRAAASRFTPSTTAATFLQPGQADYADGAYPLTVPVYAEINTLGLDAADAAAYAKVLQYLSGVGQQQGYTLGQLPPGMAPLTDALVAQTQAAVATLQAITTPTATATPKPTKTPKPTPSPTPSRSAGVPPVNPVGPVEPPAAPPPAVSTSQPAPVASSSPIPTVAVQPGITPAAQIGPLPGLALAGLIGALIAGVAAPIVGRPRRARA